MQTFRPKDFRAAYQARDLAAAHYISNPRVTLIDVGWHVDRQTGRPDIGDLRVRVHLRQQPRGASFETFSVTYPELIINKEIIPFDVDLVEAQYHLQWFGYLPQQSSPRSQVFDPLRGGISVSNEWFYNYGTLGGVVRDRDSEEDLILSNWHVLAGSAYAPQGLRIYQPGYADGGQRQHTIAHLVRDAMNEGLDAAVARLNDTRPWINEQLDIGPVSGTAPPMLGMQVVKSGRGSELTAGIIDGVEGIYLIRYGGLPRQIKHVCRIVPTQGTEVSRGGDSGSWWLEDETNQAVALHFAGYDYPVETALAIAMPPVLAVLNVEIPS
jgi:endonuclease G